MQENWHWDALQQNLRGVDMFQISHDIHILKVTLFCLNILMLHNANVLKETYLVMN